MSHCFPTFQTESVVSCLFASTYESVLSYESQFHISYVESLRAIAFVCLASLPCLLSHGLMFVSRLLLLCFESCFISL
jgi:hypothetical protein